MAALMVMFGSFPVDAASLLTRIVPLPRKISDSVIVGRGRCAEDIWLLNGERQLLKVSQSQMVTIHPLRGLEPEDQPWGLACLSDNTAWTLATPRILARIRSDGAIVERVKLQTPWIQLFGTGDRLLFAQVSPIIGSPLLATAGPRQPQNVRSWPGLLARAAGSRGDLIAQNLVNCGLPRARAVPCWFPGGTDVTLSDGVRPRRHSFPWVRGADVDATIPLRDVAFVARDRVWLLATSPHLVGGRRVGGRLLLGTAAGREVARVDVNPPARAVLFATDKSCLLLTAGGDLMEVIEP